MQLQIEFLCRMEMLPGQGEDPWSLASKMQICSLRLSDRTRTNRSLASSNFQRLQHRTIKPQWKKEAGDRAMRPESRLDLHLTISFNTKERWWVLDKWGMKISIGSRKSLKSFIMLSCLQILWLTKAQPSNSIELTQTAILQTLSWIFHKSNSNSLWAYKSKGKMLLSLQPRTGS